MIGYTTLGTDDMARASEFYDALLGTLGATRVMDNETFIAWATAPTSPFFCLTLPYDKKAATVGNGVMIALQMDSQEKVDALYNKAMELGAQDEGKPGPRGDGFYAGYFRDLDGNKLNAFFMG